MERTDWQSDKALEREAITHKTQHMTANTVYELHHTDSYKNHTHQEKLDERQFSGVLSTSAYSSLLFAELDNTPENCLSSSSS